MDSQAVLATQRSRDGCSVGGVRVAVVLYSHHSSSKLLGNRGQVSSTKYRLRYGELIFKGFFLFSHLPNKTKYPFFY